MHMRYAKACVKRFVYSIPVIHRSEFICDLLVMQRKDYLEVVIIYYEDNNL